MPYEEAARRAQAAFPADTWNRVSDPWDVDPYDTWTQEGIPLDHLRFWGGVRPGRVYGESDRNGAYPQKDAVHPYDLIATLYHALAGKPLPVIHRFCTNLPTRNHVAKGFALGRV